MLNWIILDGTRTRFGANMTESEQSIETFCRGVGDVTVEERKGPRIVFHFFPRLILSLCFCIIIM